MSTRSYDMTGRARAAEATRLRIIDAAVALFMESDLAGMTLEAVARRAGVTLQTVLRRFGSKSGLVSAAIEHKTAEVMRLRTPPPAGDITGAITVLLNTYEELGHVNWRMLCHEANEPLLHDALGRARAIHRAWLEQVFAAQLPARGTERERRLDLLFGASDFYLWKLWRHDLGHSPEQTRQQITQLLTALLQSFGQVEARGCAREQDMEET